MKITLRLPEWLHKQLRACAKRAGISINQLISTAAAEKLAALTTEEYLESRARRANRAKFEAALASVPDVEPEPADRKPARPTRRRPRRR